MITRTPLVLVAAVVLAASCPPPSVAAPAPVDPSCVLLLPDGGGTLINRCRGCREVTLERQRPGEGIPSIRAMTLPGEAASPAPFRGPGRTRVLSERSCPLPPGSQTARTFTR